MDQHLAADRKADGADPLWVDIRTTLKKRGCRMQVTVADPTESIRVTFACALAAAIEEEDAVAVTHEHSRLLLRTRAARDDDHGRAVSRRHEPALEAETVARLEGDVFV